MSDVTFTIGAVDAATGVLTALSGNFGKLGNVLVSLASGNVVGAFTAGINAAVDVLKESINAAADAETGMTRLAATLIATGRGSEISAAQIGKIATSLMGVSTFDDEAIVNAYNVLSKFESIPTGNMEQIVKTAMDMSAAMGGDLAANTEAIGRALETGVIPRTWGFSAALKSQFADEVKAGQGAKALSLMMSELNKRYGGQAAAEMKTYAGQLKVMKNAWVETEEELGKKLIPTLTKTMQTYSETMKMTDLYVTAQKNGLKVNTDWISGQMKLNGHLVSYEQLLYSVTIAELSHARAMGEETGKEKDFIPVIQDVTQALGDMNDAVISRTSWEESFSGAKDFAEKAKLEFDMLGSGIQAIKEQGGLIWESYLAATGGISKAALYEFVKIEQEIAFVQKMVAAGLNINVIVNWIISQQGQPVGQNPYNQDDKNPVPSVPVTKGNPYWIPDPAHPGHYMLNPNYHKASGGSFAGWAMVGDAPGGRRTAYSEYVYAPHGATVYNQAQMSGRSAPPMSSGGMIPPMQQGVELSQKSLRALADMMVSGLARIR